MSRFQQIANSISVGKSEPFPNLLIAFTKTHIQAQRHLAIKHPNAVFIPHAEKNRTKICGKRIKSEFICLRSFRIDCNLSGPYNLFRRKLMSFGIYAVGYLILIAGVAYLAHLFHIPQHYILAIALIMLGIGVITGVQTTRHKDPS